MPYWQMRLLAGAGLRYRKKSRVPRRKCLCGNGLRRGSRYPLKVSRILPVWHMGRLARDLLWRLVVSPYAARVYVEFAAEISS